MAHFHAPCYHGRMKSSDIAKIADVSVRTLRHYHDLGLMPEPPRHENGYRNYSALDLARLLRIKRLAALGFSLADIKDMLDTESENNARAATKASPTENQALEQLDAELEMRIEQLQEQRKAIAALRKEQLNPSLPIRFAQLVKRLYGSEAADLNVFDSAALAVAGHLYDEEELEELERFTNKIEELGLLEDLHALEHRIEELPANASEEQKQILVEDAMLLLRPVIPCFKPENWEDDINDDVWNLLDSLLNVAANEAQIEVGRMIEEAIVDEIHRLRS